MMTTLTMYKKEDYLLSKKCFLLIFFIFVLGPWFASFALKYMYSDLMVQVKCGLWMLDNRQLLTEDVFSWHENLNWCPHEMGWYLISGILYRIGGVYAIIGFAYASILSIGYLFYKEVKEHSLFSIVLTSILFLTTAVYGLYNVRPAIISTPLFILLITTLWNDGSVKKCGILFLVEAFVIAWCHGGMIPLLFVIFAVAIIIDLVYKRYKRAGALSLYFCGGLVLSLCSPIGIEVWTYAFTQSQASDVWKYISEWSRGNLGFFDSIVIVATTLCFMFTSGVRRFDRKAILKAAYICMFAIMFFKYIRFTLLWHLVMAFVVPEVYDVLWVWLYKRFSVIRRVTRVKWVSKLFTNQKLILSKILVGIAGVGSLCSVIGMCAILQAYPNNSLNDVAEKAGKPQIIIDEIKSRGYERLFNSYDNGTWLLFNDIKVSQDNRCDLYLDEFSDEEYICMGMDSYKRLDDWVTKFHPDAVLYSYTSDESELIRIMNTFHPERYELVFSYDAPHEGLIALDKEKDETSEVTHWCIYEVKE